MFWKVEVVFVHYFLRDLFKINHGFLIPWLHSSGNPNESIGRELQIIMLYCIAQIGLQLISEQSSPLLCRTSFFVSSTYHGISASIHHQHYLFLNSYQYLLYLLHVWPIHPHYLIKTMNTSNTVATISSKYGAGVYNPDFSIIYFNMFMENITNFVGSNAHHEFFLNYFFR